MTIEIREMTIADYADAIVLWQSMEGIGLSSADSREAISRYLQRNPGMSFVARGEDGALVGAVLIGHDGRRGFVHHLAVRADCRKQGIGRALMEKGLAALKGDGIDKCHLFVFARNQAGRAFWKQLEWYERPELTLMSKDL